MHKRECAEIVAGQNAQKTVEGRDIKSIEQTKEEKRCRAKRKNRGKREKGQTKKPGGKGK